MSQSWEDSGGDQSENHDPDDVQERNNNSETRKNSLAVRSKVERQRIHSWREKINESDGHHDAAEDDARDDSCLPEDLQLTPLHALLDSAKDDDDGLRQIKSQPDQWKGIIDVRSPEHEETALHMAVRKGFNNMACQLLKYGAKVNIENGSGEPPLHVACNYGNQQLVEMLLENGADPEHLDASGTYPLHSAVVRGFEVTVVRDLLGSEGSIINKTVGGVHWTPLNKAIYYRCEDVVDVLLEGGASLRIKDSDGWTPLTTAIKRRLYGTFHKLLSYLREHPDQRFVVNIPDNDGLTPLMQLAANKPADSVTHAVEDLLWMNPDVNATDNEEKTALHHAMVSLAPQIEINPYTDVALKLVNSLSVDTLLKPDKDGETAFDVAFDHDKKIPIPTLEPLWDLLANRLLEGGSIEALLCWAAYRLERHTFALSLFRKSFAAEEIPKETRNEWTIVEWAVYARMPRVLQTYLRTLGLEKRVNEGDKIDRSISNGQALIKSLMGAARQSSHSTTIGADSIKDVQALKNMEDILDYINTEKPARPTKPLTLSEPEPSMKASLERFRATIIKNNLVKFRTIQEFLYDGDSMEHIQDNANRVKQFEYTPTVFSDQASQTFDEFLSNTKTSAHFTWIHLPSTNMIWMDDTVKKILKLEGCDKSEAEKVASFLRSSWIEIPDRTCTSRFMRPRYVVKKADNATKCHAEDDDELRDLSERLSSSTGVFSRHNKQRGKRSSYEYHGHNPGQKQADSFGEFASDSWGEPKQTQSNDSHLSGSSQIGIANRGEEDKGKSFAVSAIYMPYLYFSTYHQSESAKEVATDPIVGTGNPPDDEERLQDEIRMRRELFNAYKNSVIHQPTTLDEFYYQFASDDDSLSDRDSRNKDQVVTKYLLGRDIKKQTCWPLLRVNQLWIWTIDGKWLITSTSCATHNIRDNLVADILEHLRRQVENGSRRFGPTSAAEMSRVIVDYCIGTYDRKRKRQTGGTPSSQGQRQLSTDNMSQSTIEDAKRKQERSIHQIFSDSINEIGRKESRLFSLSYRHNNDTGELETGLNADHSSKKMKALQNKLEKVAKLLRNIKDIRDELNILKSIAAFQHKVQSTMAGSGAKEELSSFYLLRDIEELEKFADKTQEAVKTTLTLQESGIANWQASQSFKQGRVVLVFTLVTVWFLPLSFLTSLFALDVGTFMEAPAWAFYIIFLVPLIFLALAVGFVWKGDETWDYCAKLKKALVKSSDQEPKEGRSTARSVPSESVPRKRNGTDLERG